MRIFVGLDIDPAIRERIAQFQADLRAVDPRQKWVGVESFHITLKFIGEKPEQEVEEIARALASVRALPMTASFRGCGFFPNERSARVFWVGIHPDDNLVRLAYAVDEVAAKFGLERERDYKPHLTLARARTSSPRGASAAPNFRPGDRPNPSFALIQEKLRGMPEPDFGTMTASEFILYESKLSPQGAHYKKLRSFRLADE